MNSVKEPIGKWGGSWTDKKLNAFENYVRAYLTIMQAQKEKYNGWPTTIYFDGFVGSGSRYNEEGTSLFSEYFNENEINVYKGSAERVLRLKQKFDYYYFIDSDKAAIQELETKLKDSGLVNNNCHFINDDVNNQLIKLLKILDEKTAALVLLDPFGMQVNWNSIEVLVGKRVDIWILLPSGVIINRLLDSKGKLTFSNKLESFFGLTIDEIKDRFYKIEENETLFDTEQRLKKVDDSISKIAELYISKLKNIFIYVTESPMILYNDKNIAIYHFIFASNNETAHKIAKYIIKEKTK